MRPRKGIFIFESPSKCYASCNARWNLKAWRCFLQYTCFTTSWSLYIDLYEKHTFAQGQASYTWRMAACS